MKDKFNKQIEMFLFCIITIKDKFLTFFSAKIFCAVNCTVNTFEDP
jgi:hypothetical protein